MLVTGAPDDLSLVACERGRLTTSLPPPPSYLVVVDDVPGDGNGGTLSLSISNFDAPHAALGAVYPTDTFDSATGIATVSGLITCSGADESGAFIFGSGIQTKGRPTTVTAAASRWPPVMERRGHGHSSSFRRSPCSSPVARLKLSIEALVSAPDFGSLRLAGGHHRHASWVAPITAWRHGQAVARDLYRVDVGPEQMHRRLVPSGVREDGQMEFRILGSLEVCSDGGELALGGRRPRALVAVLALHANEVVAADRLIDEIWGEDVPEGAARRCGSISLDSARRFRADVLMTRPPGYLLRVGPGELDLHRFERLVDEGRRLLADGPAADASARLREALAVWRGPRPRRLRLRGLRPDGRRPARGDQARRAGAADRRRPRPRASRRTGGRTQGTRRRAPAPRTLPRLPDDGAVPVGSAGGGPGRLPGCAPDPRRRARDRAQSGAPGAGAGDPSAGPRVGSPGDDSRSRSRGRGAVDPRRRGRRGPRPRAARGGRAARAPTAARR